jgi:ACDE family multidrug resistance protein
MFKESKGEKEKVAFFAGVNALKKHKLRSVGLIALLYNLNRYTRKRQAPRNRA